MSFRFLVFFLPTHEVEANTIPYIKQETISSHKTGFITDNDVLIYDNDNIIYEFTLGKKTIKPVDIVYDYKWANAFFGSTKKAVVTIEP